MINQAGLDGADDDGLDFPFGHESSGEEAIGGNSKALGGRVRPRVCLYLYPIPTPRRTGDSRPRRGLSLVGMVLYMRVTLLVLCFA